jgi:NAD(P)H dehydrogenase (quinone)
MRIMHDHKATESHLHASGVPHVILRNDWYVENYTDNAGPVLQHGVMSGAAGEGRVSVAPRADYAEAAAAVLASDGHAGRVYELGGDRAHSLAEIAAELGRVSGKRIEYRDMAEVDYAAFLVQVGVPEPYARLLADADTGIKQGHLQNDTGDLGRLLGRPTTPLPTAIERALRSC